MLGLLIGWLVGCCLILIWGSAGVVPDDDDDGSGRGWALVPASACVGHEAAALTGCLVMLLLVDALAVAPTVSGLRHHSRQGWPACLVTRVHTRPSRFPAFPESSVIHSGVISNSRVRLAAVEGREAVHASNQPECCSCYYFVCSRWG